jgi:hypothetical protein
MWRPGIDSDRREMLLVGLVVVISLTFTACNYRFGGYRERPVAIQSLNIAPFENQTRQVGIEALFTNDLVYEVGRGDRITLAAPGSADAVLTGVISNLRANTISRQNLNISLERRVYVTVELIVKSSQGQQIWNYKLKENETYFVQTDKVSTEANLRFALEKISQRIAEKFHYRFTQAF